MDKLDLALGDIINTNRKTNRSAGNKKPANNKGRGGRRNGGRGGNRNRGNGNGNDRQGQEGGRRGGGYGAQRRQRTRGNRNGPYNGGNRGAGAKSQTVVHASNLATNLDEDDLRNVFQRMGPLKKLTLNYDRNGRFSGTCEIRFATNKAAEEAVKEYDSAELNGRKFYLKLIAPVGYNKTNTVEDSKKRGKAASAAPKGGKGAKAGKKAKREPVKAPTLEDLDAEMEAYQNSRNGVTTTPAATEEVVTETAPSKSPETTTATPKKSVFDGQPPSLSAPAPAAEEPAPAVASEPEVTEEAEPAAVEETAEAADDADDASEAPVPMAED